MSLRKKPAALTTDVEAKMLQSMGLSINTGLILIGIWLAVLIIAIVLRETVQYSDAPAIHWFEAFYRTGSLIFGGGQVVLPLLLGEVDTWMTEEQFYAGLGVVQALPGPLFNLSAYLGAVIGGVGGIAACWIGLFAPGIILIYGVLPFWAKFRNYEVYRGMLPGMNAAAVGLIVAACITMSLKVHFISPFPSATVVIGMFSFSAVHFFKVQAPLAVLGSGVGGLVAWGIGMK